jgi:hypothetical protein
MGTTGIGARGTRSSSAVALSGPGNCTAFHQSIAVRPRSAPPEQSEPVRQPQDLCNLPDLLQEEKENFLYFKNIERGRNYDPMRQLSGLDGDGLNLIARLPVRRSEAY